MTIEISTTDPRSVKALAILGTADRWQKGRTRDGRSFYAVPSQRGDVLHMTDTRGCTCQDFRRRQAACKHVLAVRLHVARLKGQSPRRPASSPERAFELRALVANA